MRLSRCKCNKIFESVLTDVILPFTNVTHEKVYVNEAVHSNEIYNFRLIQRKNQIKT